MPRKTARKKTAQPPLREQWDTLRAERRMRNRDAAEALGVSEGELIACIAGDGATRLKRAPLAILREACMLGRVMALTRNASVVHEKKGIYMPATGEDHVGLVLGDDIDLRLFFAHWVHAFAVEEPDGEKPPRRSLQFFDAAGDAVHKIHLLEGSDLVAFDGIVEGYANEDQSREMAKRPKARKPPERPDAQIEAGEFRKGWHALRDTHEFFGLMKRFGVSRTQALRLADGEHARRVDNRTIRGVLHEAARGSVPIMVFVGNPGCIQIHSGPVANVQTLGPWLNVLDPGFNLHLREDHVAQSWIVRKPTSEGIVTSLELFDAAGALIAQLFGVRKPGVPERDDWRELVEAAASPEASHA